MAEDLQLLQVQVTQYGAGGALAAEVQSMLDDGLIRLLGSSSSSRKSNKAGGGVDADEDADEDDGWLSEDEEEGEAGRGWNATQQQWVDDIVAVAASEMAAIWQVWGKCGQRCGGSLCEGDKCCKCSWVGVFGQGVPCAPVSPTIHTS